MLTKYYLGDQITKNEMGRSCSTFRRGQRRVWFGKPKGKRTIRKAQV